MKASAGGLKKGEFLELNNEIYVITKIEHNFRGRGSANIKLKVKSVTSGNTVEKTFKPDTTVEQVGVDSTMMQYLFSDDENCTFMNEQTYEQFEVNKKVVGDVAQYLKEGQGMYVMVHDGNAIAVRPPQTVRLKVTHADDAAKGDTATNARKSVTVETGATVQVPIFIKQGETIAINPETGEYLERA